MHALFGLLIQFIVALLAITPVLRRVLKGDEMHHLRSGSWEMGHVL